LTTIGTVDVLAAPVKKSRLVLEGKKNLALSVAIHSSYDYNDKDIRNDLALVKLTEPYLFAENIGASELASENSPQLMDGDLCAVVGWGQIVRE